MLDNLLKKLRQRLRGQLRALDTPGKTSAIHPVVREARKMQIEDTLEWIDKQMKEERWKK